MLLAAAKASSGASRTIIRQIGIESRVNNKLLAYRLFRLAEVDADVPAVTILTRGPETCRKSAVSGDRRFARGAPNEIR
jgi:hypothetical protein